MNIPTVTSRLLYWLMIQPEKMSARQPTDCCCATKHKIYSYTQLQRIVHTQVQLHQSSKYGG